MKFIEIDPTNPTQLRAICDWAQHLVWKKVREKYEPLLLACCRKYRLDPETAEEICQRVWILVADRIRTFEYNPRKSFRGWLWQRCCWTILDYLEQREAESMCSLDERDDPRDRRPFLPCLPEMLSDADDERGPGLSRWEQLSPLVQEAVRRKTSPQHWEAYCLRELHGWTAEEVAAVVNMSATAVYAASARVKRRLREEGQRVLSEKID
jgi:RNA polymerase sigma-70 factor (ECF subfamily)